jgi:hypothetical protein
MTGLLPERIDESVRIKLAIFATFITAAGTTACFSTIEVIIDDATHVYVSIPPFMAWPMDNDDDVGECRYGMVWLMIIMERFVSKK